MLIREYKSWRVQNVQSPIYPWRRFRKAVGKQAPQHSPSRQSGEITSGKGTQAITFLPLGLLMSVKTCQRDSNSHAVTVNPVGSSCLAQNRAGQRNTSHRSITLGGLPFIPGRSRITPEGWKSNLFPSTKANLLLSSRQCNYRLGTCTCEQVHCSPLRASFA